MSRAGIGQFGLAVLACAAMPCMAWAQDQVPAESKGPQPPGPWQPTVTLGLNLSQSSFSSNWAGGDKGSFVWVFTTNAKADRQISRALNTSNQLQLAYGQTSQQETDPADPSRRRWRSPDKTTDLILFENVERFTLRTFVDPYVSLRLDSQFVDQSDARGKLHFNPVKLTETAGVARVLLKTQDSELITRLGFGFRQTFARTFVDSTGDKTGSFSTNDGGFEYQMTSTQPMLGKRVLYQGKLLVFWPVFFSKSSALKDFDQIALGVDPARERVADFWKTPDVNFQNTFTAQITKVLSVNLYVQWIYDKFDAATMIDTAQPAAQLIAEVDGGVRKAGQFKQTLALSLTYKLL
jgi:hypothetical protein